jgi:hypothetical protein
VHQAREFGRPSIAVIKVIMSGRFYDIKVIKVSMSGRFMTVLHSGTGTKHPDVGGRAL